MLFSLLLFYFVYKLTSYGYQNAYAWIKIFVKFFQIFEKFSFQETAFVKDNVFHVVQILKENNLNIIWDLVRFLMKNHQGFQSYNASKRQTMKKRVS